MFFETRALFQKFQVPTNLLLLKVKNRRLKDTLNRLLLIVGEEAGPQRLMFFSDQCNSNFQIV